MSDDGSKNDSKFGWPFWLLLGVVLAAAAAVAVPNFIKARNTRSRNPCIANLKQIDGAVQQWALENKQTATDTYSLSDPTLLAYIKGSALPECPQGGRYLPGTNVGSNPRCSLRRMGHTL